MISQGRKAAFRFRCEDISPSTELTTHPENILHLKGFARRLDPSLTLPEAALSLMRSCEVLAFDGDAIHSESFTKFLVSLLASYMDIDLPPRPPKILAYRLDYSVLSTSQVEKEEQPEGGSPVNTAVTDVSRDCFLASWLDTVATIDEVGCLSVQGGQEQDLASPPVITIFIKTLFPSCTPKQRSPYLELGLQALLNSGSTRVLAVGGGAVVGDEYTLYRARIPSLQWHAWLVDRAVADSESNSAVPEGGKGKMERREKCYFQKLLDEKGSTLDVVQFIFSPSVVIVRKERWRTPECCSCS